jgi:nucleotide-binding universal stress UspA family protein
MPRLHTIIAAVDFSQTAGDVLEAASELAGACHGHVHLIHVVPDPLQVPYGVEPLGFDLTGMLREWTTTAQGQLTELAGRQQPKPEFLTIAVPSGNPAAEILKYAAEQRADLIVLGSHGRGFVDRLLLGNVAERVLRRADCTVMVVPHRVHHPTTFEVRAAGSVGS